MSRLPLVSPYDRMLFLKAQPYLEGVPSRVLSALASYTEERFVPAGSWVRFQDAPVQEILFLGYGSVSIERRSGELQRTTQVDSPGVIGLADHFAQTVETPAVRAIADTLCLTTDVTDFDQILEDHFPLLLKLARRGAEEVIALHRQLGERRPPEQGFRDRNQRETPVHLDLVQRLSLTRHAPLLRGSNLTILAELIRTAEPRVVSEGEPLWKEGEPISGMAVVLDGSFHSVGPCATGLAPAGSTIGAWETLSDGARFETWIADRPSRVLPIKKEVFIDLLEDHLEFALTYLENSSQKIIEAWALLAEAG